MRDYVVAIDLGTSCTAYSWRSSAHTAMDHVFVGVPDSKVTADKATHKTPTCLLIGGAVRQDKEFEYESVEAFGRQAEDRFRENDFQNDAQLFKHFKMELHREREFNDDLHNATTSSVTDRADMKLQDTFFLALQYIKDLALKKMRVSPHHVTWVLTVPASCKEPAKTFMRRAAVRAGLIQGGHDDEHLRICLEPVAACLALEESLQWKRNDKYLVVDCGGGTVDICAFEVVGVQPPMLNQLGGSTSGPWGSTFVDKALSAFLMEFVDLVAPNAGKLKLDSFEKGPKYRIMQAWEKAKINLDSLDRGITLDLSELGRELRVDSKAMEEGRFRINEEGVDLVGGTGTNLILRPALLQRLFDFQCTKIAEAVSAKLKSEELRGLTLVIMVGGFSGSVHVQKAVKNCIHNAYPGGGAEMRVARNPDLAIVQGAAFFGGDNTSGGPASVQKFPCAAPQFNRITCDTSYGILIAEHGKAEVAAFFDAFLVKGEGYHDGHKVLRNDFTVGTIVTLAIGTCASPAVKEGRNDLNKIGGLPAVLISRSQNLKIQTPPPAMADAQGVAVPCFGICSMFRRAKSVVANVQNTTEFAENGSSLSVEFCLMGVELHIEAKLRDGRVLMKHVVPFGE